MVIIRNGNKRLWYFRIAGQGFSADWQTYFGAVATKVGRTMHNLGGISITQKNSFHAVTFFPVKDPISWIMCNKTALKPNEAFDDIKWIVIDPRSYFRTPTPGARYGY